MTKILKALGRPFGEAIEGIAKGLGHAAKETAKVIKKNPILVPLIAANPSLLPMLTFGAIPEEAALALSQVLRVATPIIGASTGGLAGLISGLGLAPALDEAVAGAMKSGAKFVVPDLSKLLLFGAVTTPPKKISEERQVTMSPEAWSVTQALLNMLGEQGKVPQGWKPQPLDWQSFWAGR